MVAKSIIIFIILAAIVALLAMFAIHIVPQGEVWIIERLGKFNRVIKPGFRLVFFHPYYEKIRKRVIIKEQMLDVPDLEVITKDNVSVTADAITFIKVKDPKKATYEIVDYERGIKTLVKTAIRSVVGVMELDDALANRDKIKKVLKAKIIEDTHRWGIEIMSIEVVHLHPSGSMQKTMEQEATAERERRALEIQSEGHKRSKILEAEAHLEVAKIHAKAYHIEVDAQAHALKAITQANESGDSSMPINFILGGQYLDTLKSLSKSDNSKFVVYPADLQNSLKGFMAMSPMVNSGKDEEKV